MAATLHCGTAVGGLRVRVASDFWMRARGLLGGPALAEDEALLIAPCSSIHTIAMRYAIDVVFLDRSARILRVCPNVVPGRIRIGWGAAAVLELRAGQAARHGFASGIAAGALCKGLRPLWRGFRRSGVDTPKSAPDS